MQIAKCDTSNQSVCAHVCCPSQLVRKKREPKTQKDDCDKNWEWWDYAKWALFANRPEW
jgi:hypothetical protein